MTELTTQKAREIAKHIVSWESINPKRGFIERTALGLKGAENADKIIDIVESYGFSLCYKNQNHTGIVLLKQKGLL